MGQSLVRSTTTQQWDASMMSLQQGKIVIITGGNTGIGLGAARRFVEHGAHVIMAGIGETYGRQAEETIREGLTHEQQSYGGTIEYMYMDLGSQSSIAGFVASFREKYDHLDYLLNNAGVCHTNEKYSTDGLPIHFGVNHLGHFYLTSLLFDLLQASSSARIVNTSSVSHRLTYSKLMYSNTELNFDTILTDTENGPLQYEQSKLINVIFTLELDRRLRAANIDNILAVCAHPGVCNTPIVQATTCSILNCTMQGWMESLLSILFQSGDMGALPLLYAATVETVQSGDFYGPNGWFPPHWSGYPELEIPHHDARKKEYGQKLWELSEKLIKRRFSMRM